MEAANAEGRSSHFRSIGRSSAFGRGGLGVEVGGLGVLMVVCVGVLALLRERWFDPAVQGAVKR